MTTTRGSTKRAKRTSAYWLCSVFAAFLFATLHVTAFQPTEASAQPHCSQSVGCGGDRRPPGHGGGGKVGIGIGIDFGKIIADQAKKKPKPKKARKPKKKKPKKRIAKPRPAPRPVPVAQDHVPNELILSFEGTISDAVINLVLRTYGLRKLEQENLPLINRRIVRAFGSSNLSRGRMRQLNADPRVSTTLNYIYRLSAGNSVQYAVSRLNIEDAHRDARGKDVLIAVIDSGVELAHPAIQGARLTQEDVLPGKRRIKGSHGTAITSIIAAQQGMLGVAPDAEILSIRAFAPARKGKPAQGTSYTLVKALDIAYQSGAQVINMSFAGPNDDLFQEAVNAIDNLGIVMVAAAGNKGPRAKPAFPAAYPNVIAATATDGRDRLYRHANRGDYVTLAAPGVNVLVAQKTKGFGLMSGTSMAAAYVSGAVALLLQKDPSLASNELTNLLAQSAQDLGPKGKDSQFGYGIIDIKKAMAPETISTVTRSTPTHQLVSEER